MIYLDANATTPVDPAVLEVMLPFLREHYANASAGYGPGRLVQRAVEEARQQLAGLIHAESEELVFTSGGTEAINAAHASARILWPDKSELIIGATEHPAVLESAKRWSANGGRVTSVPVERNGRVNLAALKAAVQAGQTALVSLMWANNETGVISDIAAVAEIAHAAGALLHTDAVQAVGKIPVDVKRVPVDFLSLSGHKMHAPKGVGALFVSARARFTPLLVGGGQERERRSGTENVAGIVALGHAAELCRSHLNDGTMVSIRKLRDAFEQRLRADFPDMQVHGDLTRRLGNTSLLSIPAVDAAGMLILLDKAGVACSAGSACHTGDLHPSHVLEAMGIEAAEASSTLRFSFHRFNTQDEVETAAKAVIRAAHKLRAERGDGCMVISN